MRQDKQPTGPAAHPPRQSWAELSAGPRWCYLSLVLSLLYWRLGDGLPHLLPVSSAHDVHTFLMRCKAHPEAKRRLRCEPQSVPQSKRTAGVESQTLSGTGAQGQT